MPIGSTFTFYGWQVAYVQWIEPGPGDSIFRPLGEYLQERRAAGRPPFSQSVRR